MNAMESAVTLLDWLLHAWTAQSTYRCLLLGTKADMLADRF